MASASIPENAQDASLERLGINVQTVAPNNVMTSKEANKVKFTKSRPIGYLIPNVDGFVGLTQESIEWYEQALLSRDQDVLRLGSELDRVEVELLRARQEMAVAAANAPFQEAVQSAKDDPEVEAIMRKATEAERKVERTEKRLTAANEESTKRKQRIEELEAQLAAALSGESTQAPGEAQVDSPLLAENESLRVQLSEAEVRVQVAEEAVAALNKYTGEQDEYIDALEAQLAQTPETAEQIEAAEEYTTEDQGGFDLEHYEGVAEAVDVDAFELASVEEASEVYEEAAPLGTEAGAHDLHETAAEFELVGGLDDEAALQLLEEPVEENLPAPVDHADQPEYDEDGNPIYYWEGKRLPPGLKPEDLVPQPLPGDDTAAGER